MMRVLAVLGIVALLLTGCASASSAPDVQTNGEDGLSPRSFVLPTKRGAWTPPQEAYVSQKPTGKGRVHIAGIGQFTFDASEVKTQRPDIFVPGHFSVFDTLVQISEQGDIDLDYHFDEALDTHVVDAINGDSGGWWYAAYYSAGWYEKNVFRMDMFPYKDRTFFRLYREDAENLDHIYRTFEQEAARLEKNDGQVIIPEVTIHSPRANYTFRDVVVTPHNVRSDVLQPGAITALDALLSLGEQGELPVLKLTWYDSIGEADPVQHYFVERIGESEAYGGCGFVYETGPEDFRGFRGSHIHIPSDLRITVSPEYALWFWICI